VSQAKRILDTLTAQRPDSDELGILAQRHLECTSAQKIAEALDLSRLPDLKDHVMRLKAHWPQVPTPLRFKINAAVHRTWLVQLVDTKAESTEEQADVADRLVQAQLPLVVADSWQGDECLNSALVENVVFGLETEIEAIAAGMASETTQEDLEKAAQDNDAILKAGTRCTAL
jgi:hypothetical protein